MKTRRRQCRMVTVDGDPDSSPRRGLADPYEAGRELSRAETREERAKAAERIVEAVASGAREARRE